MTDVFSPAALGPVTLRNRVIKAATFEGRTPDGLVTDALIDFHRGPARGGVGMTTVAYCAVSPEGRTDRHQLWTVFDDGTIRNVSNPSLCLDANARNGDVGNGAQVTAWPCNGGSNQKWTILGDLSIRNVSNTALCLDASAPRGFVAPGANVTAWRCNGGSNQKWF